MEKTYVLTTSTADNRVERQSISNVYGEGTLLCSDYKNSLPKRLHETKVIVEEVAQINCISCEKAESGKYTTWVTTITRIA